MKWFYILNNKLMRAFLSIFLMMIIAGVIKGQAIPNGGFETWTQTGSYAEPTPWNTPNPTTSSLSTYTVTKESTLVQSGSYAARVQTKSVLGFTIPGLMTLGAFSINLVTMEATITGGIPFNYRPDSLTGFIQYEPKFGDECFIGALLLKQNGTSWDTLGTGSFSSTSTLLNWTRFSCPIDYNSANVPTHLNIIILSSDRNSPQPNSSLYIDNLAFQYNPVSVASHDRPDFSATLYGNQLHICSKENVSGKHTVQLFSIDGRLLFSEEAYFSGANYVSAPIPGLPAGVVILSISDGIRPPYTRKLTTLVKL